VDIIADDVEVVGTHGPLLGATSLRVRDGQVLLVAGDPGSGRTALALALAGRLRPTRGTVHGGSSRELRRRVAIVDAPGITEPEGSVPVRDVVSEGLSLAGRGAGRAKVRAWLSERDLAQRASQRFEHLPGATRTRVLLDLACESRTTEALILDCPDRHGGDPLGWYSLAAREAERGHAVAVLCSPHSAEKLGVAYARVGTDNRSCSSTVDFASNPERRNFPASAQH
jgi:ABC-type Mn2+/Zn2+ transport system ATPase subunit